MAISHLSAGLGYPGSEGALRRGPIICSTQPEKNLLFALLNYPVQVSITRAGIEAIKALYHLGDRVTVRIDAVSADDKIHRLFCLNLSYFSQMLEESSQKYIGKASAFAYDEKEGSFTCVSSERTFANNERLEKPEVVKGFKATLLIGYVVAHTILLFETTSKKGFPEELCLSLDNDVGGNWKLMLFQKES